MHGLCSLFIMSNSDLLYTERELNFEQKINQLKRGNIMKKLRGRFFYKDFIILYISFWVVLIVCYLFKKTFLDWGIKLSGYCVKGEQVQKSATNVEDVQNRADFSNDFYKELLI